MRRERKNTRNYSHFARCQHLILIGQLAMGQTTQCTRSMKIAHQCILNQCELEHKTPTRGRDNEARVRMKCGFRFVEAVSFHPPAFKPHPGHEIWFSRANDVQTSYDLGPGTLELRTLFGFFIQLLWCYIIINIPIFYCKEENFISMLWKNVYKGAVLVQFSFSLGK